MQELSKIARPYAVAAFRQAQDEGTVAEWSDMLDLLAMMAQDPMMAGLIANPNVRREELGSLVIDVCGDRLSETGCNFVRLLAANGRLEGLPEMARLYREERARSEARSQVEIVSAFELSDDERGRIVATLTERLGTKLETEVRVDPELIGGIVVRAGDMVIDASMRGQLAELARAVG